MARTVLRIDGLRELRDKLRKIDADMRKNAVKPAVSAGAEPIVKRASQLAPRSSKPRSSLGHLADNIKAENPRLTANGAGVRMGPSDGHYWGLFLELGTSKMRARPFLRPALDFEAKAAVEAMRGSLRESLKKAAE